MNKLPIGTRVRLARGKWWAGCRAHTRDREGTVVGNGRREPMVARVVWDGTRPSSGQSIYVGFLTVLSPGEPTLAEKQTSLAAIARGDVGEFRRVTDAFCRRVDARIAAKPEKPCPA